MTKTLCDYCGGWKWKVKKGKNKNPCRTENFIALSLTEDTHPKLPAIKRSLCIRCWIKVFDTILGEPKK